MKYACRARNLLFVGSVSKQFNYTKGKRSHKVNEDYKLTNVNSSFYATEALE
jgi:hypothetical protein